MINDKRAIQSILERRKGQAQSEATIRTHQEEIEFLEDWINDELSILFPDAGRPVLGSVWPCPESPLGDCVYDNAVDSMHDQCLICGDPEERK